MEELIMKMTLDDLPINCRAIAEKIGIDNLVLVCSVAGGAEIYLPKTETLLRPARDKMIKEEFNGYNHKELASKYNITINRVKQICGKGICRDQLSLLDIMEQ